MYKWEKKNTRVNIWKRKLEYPSKKKNKDLHKSKTKTQKNVSHDGEQKRRKNGKKHEKRKEKKTIGNRKLEIGESKIKEKKNKRVK